MKKIKYKNVSLLLNSLIPKATTPTLHLTLDWASCSKSGQLLFRFLHSLSRVRLHVTQGLPFLLPIPIRGFYCIACPATEDSFFRKICPIQPHLCLLMFTSICCISAIFSRFPLDIVFDQ